MSKRFYEDLDKLKVSIREMGALAEIMIHDALEMLVRRDAAYLKKIIENEVRMDQFQRDIDNETIRLIGVYTPVAGDLRILLMVTRINAELERIGDKAMSIGRNYEKLLQEEPLKPLVDIPRMGEIAIRMLHGSLSAFFSNSVEEALNVIREDDEVDRLNRQVFKELLGFMHGDTTHTRRALGLILVGRSIERIADRAVNIAEDVVYMVQGKDIRHEHGADPAAAVPPQPPA